MTIHGKTPGSGFVLYFFFVSISLAGFCSGVTIIPQGQYIRDMNETLVSLEGNFELGFFSPQNSSLRYVGIWYHKIEEKEIVWVANRETPLYDRNGVLRVGEDGNLVVLDVDGYGVWSSNISVSSGKTAATLLDSGNLVLSSIDSLGDISKALWQSFDHPTDTYLPGMRVRVNAAMGENRVFTSWKSANDPGPGNFTVGIDPNGAPQIVIWDKGRRRWRSGQWNGVIFTGVPEMSVLTSYLFGFKLSPPEADGSMFFSYLPSNASVLLRFHVDWTGKEQKLKWDGDKKVWDVVLSQPANECELYNYCGNFGICNTVKFGKCSCLSGFEPTSADEWSRGNWSGGCVRREKLQCERNVNGEPGKRESDGFKEFRCVKLPDFGNIVPSADPQACRSKCLEDCSCNAYADIMGIGCMIWTGPLVDIQEFDDGGNLLFLRLAHSELGGRRTFSMVAIIVVAVVGTCFFISCVWKLWGFKSRRQAMSGFSSFSDLKDSEIPMFDVSKSREFSDDLSRSAELLLDGKQVSGSELLFFNYRFVAAATDNFSEVNKLGRGGFGTVYKGYFPGGEEIAVKRLSGRSGQGLEEFKNEIVLIAKLQHRNLVRLLGCSIHEEEKLLIYEYMPNRSLDCFLFDRTKQAWLDWRKRFTIIEGIARGLLYLHRDSRLRIIHRDLKSSNILLDADMNPKISDFGMARIFGSNQHEANTVRVVGTYGYMSPEYAMEGLFSVKSDVYSFGILLLEIISGKRNAGFSLSEHTSLIAYAWDLWTEDKVMELVDPSIRDTCSRNEVLKCVHIGLLCVQDSAGNRPNIHSVVLMLESENPEISMPSQPTFTFGSKGFGDDEIFVNHHDSVASNQLTISMIVGR